MATSTTMSTATSNDKLMNGQALQNRENAADYATSGAAAATAPVPEAEDPMPKEMIGWYFVEQYYNTMSKEPEKLHLYYTKRSQFIAGNEAEAVNVAVGHRQIGERIKELEIQQCKVRVTNVDAQESAKSILVQVIGEISNKAAPQRKFVQSFVLAEQPTGYYVLNDVFRYILEDDGSEEMSVEPQAQIKETISTDKIDEGIPIDAAKPTNHSVEDGAPATLSNSNDPLEREHSAQHMSRKLEEDILAKPEAEQLPKVVKADQESTPSTIVPTSTGIIPDTVHQSPAITATELPRDPVSTPVPASPSPRKSSTTAAETHAAAQPPAPAPAPAVEKPSAPRTWAERLAGPKSGGASTLANGLKNASASIAAPIKNKLTNGSTNNASATQSNHAAPAVPTSSEDATKQPGHSRAQSQQQQQNGNAGWQTAGAEGKPRPGRPQSQSTSVSNPTNANSVMAYIKNVNEKVDASILKSVLEGFGKLQYFDVSRPKNCAFVEFADMAAYRAAVEANPHTIGTEQISVEERRPRSNAYGNNFNNNRTGVRGGRPNDRTSGTSSARGGYGKDNSRNGSGNGNGNFAPRAGRGGAMTPRGGAQSGHAQPA